MPQRTADTELPGPLWAQSGAREPTRPPMTVLSAAQIGDVAREQLLERLKQKNKQLLAQRRKPQAPPPADAGVSSVTELTLSGRGLTDVDELGFFTELR